MAQAPRRLSIADILGFGSAPQRNLTQGYRQAVNRPATGTIKPDRKTFSRKIGEALTPNTRAGNEYANKIASLLDMITMTGSEEPLVQARGAAGRGDYGRAAFEGALGILSAIPGAGKVGSKAAREAAETAAERGIIAYHGSPYSFDRFSLGNIGTGEGNQAYGHGLYFAESEDVAKRYRDMQGRASRDPMMNVAYKAKSAGQDPKAILPVAFPNASENEVNDAIKRLKNVPRGSMYQVRINANPEDFIQWDKPLSDQSQKVKDVLGEGGIVAAADILSRAYRNPMYGGDLLKIDTASPAQVSQGLLEKGIAGISYPDALSRGKNVQTNNLVVFDDALIDILKKYGIAIPAIAGGGLLASQPQQDGGI